MVKYVFKRRGNMNNLCKKCKHFQQYYAIKDGEVYSVCCGACNAKPTFKTISASAKECKDFEDISNHDKKRKQLVSDIHSITCKLREISNYINKKIV